MPETAKRLLLGILCVLEFLEFMASPQGLVASLAIGLYGLMEFVFHCGLAMTIAVSGAFTLITSWFLEEW